MILDALHNAEISHINNMIDLIPASIYCKTLDGVYVNVNQASLDAMSKYDFLTGNLTKEAMVGKTDFDLFGEAIAATYRTNDREIIQNRRAVCVEEDIRTPNGDILKQISTKRPLVNSSNEIIGIIGATIVPPEKNPNLKASLSDNLTAREKDCLYLYLQGKTSKETASILEISCRTVEWHIENIKSKLNCRVKRDLLSYRDLI